jgi:hypothetical protein
MLWEKILTNSFTFLGDCIPIDCTNTSCSCVHDILSHTDQCFCFPSISTCRLLPRRSAKTFVISAIINGVIIFIFLFLFFYHQVHVTHRSIHAHRMVFVYKHRPMNLSVNANPSIPVYIVTYHCSQHIWIRWMLANASMMVFVLTMVNVHAWILIEANSVN